MKAKVNYNLEQTKDLVETYTQNPTRETVEQLADKYNKPIKSIIGKLSTEGVYRREVYRTKRGETPTTKLEIVAEIADMLETDAENLSGLDKTPKNVLQLTKKLIEKLLI